MISEVTMPSMGADMSEGTIVKWLKKEGDEVKRGDKLAEIETDKTVVEMECYNDGILKKIIVQEGQAVPVGDLIAYIGDEGDDVPETSSSQSASSEPSANDSPQVENKPESVSSSSNVKVKASPIAKKLATELGVDLGAISGTGPGGRITREDVEAAAQGSSPGGGTNEASGESKNIPLTPMRKAIAGVVSKSKSEIPHFYISNSANMTEVIKKRSEFNEKNNVKVSVNDIILFAVTQALKKFPKFNSSFNEDSLIEHKNINIGMAIALPVGLIVPAVLGCEEKSLMEISNAAKDLASRAKGSGSPLTQEENNGATFSVSNLGMFDIDEFVAIVVPPQSAILSVGKANDEVIVQDGNMVISKIMKMTLSVDHRVNDGAEAAMFLGELKQILENPDQIFG